MVNAKAFNARPRTQAAVLRAHRTGTHSAADAPTAEESMTPGHQGA
jgi:hypothetical protein